MARPSFRRLVGRRSSTVGGTDPVAAPLPEAGDPPATSISDVGRATVVGQRAENQDRAAHGPGLLVVCDGVGGHAGGARAAALAADAAAAVLAAGAGPSLVRDAVRAAHRAVRDGQVDPTVHNMAATVTAAWATDGSGARWVVGHVGDSPAWTVADGRAMQVTTDHTVAGELLAAGTIEPAAAAHHPGRRFVTRVAGAREGADPDVLEVELAPGAALVVATDGVSDVLGAEEVAAAVEAAPNAAGAAAALVEAALAAGTADNATAVVVRRGLDAGPGR